MLFILYPICSILWVLGLTFLYIVVAPLLPFVG